MPHPRRVRRIEFPRWLSALGFIAVLASFVGARTPAHAADRIWDALTTGKVSADFRYRVEWVHDDSAPKNAAASTLRTRLGYETGAVSGINLYAEFEDVSVIGPARYNDTVNGRTEFPVVADPEETELNQAFVNYGGLPATVVRLGRQRITLGNLRFVGNVGWRQNEQTFDAVLIGAKPLTDLELTYAYVINANRVFGAHHPTLADARMRTHVAYGSWSRFTPLQISAYGFLLDLNDVAAASTQTFGARAAGSQAVGSGFELAYALEFAAQRDFAEGASTNDAEYRVIEISASRGIVRLKLTQEVLGGDGVYGFSTPLATLHAFQGWADKFLATPPSGIRDHYATFVVQLFGMKLTVAAHDFAADHGGFDYGRELDVAVERRFGEHYVASLTAAVYRADENAKNTGPPATDAEKLWFNLQLRF